LKIKTILISLLCSLIVSTLTIYFFNNVGINNAINSSHYSLLTMIFINLFTWTSAIFGINRSANKELRRRYLMFLLLVSICYFTELLLINNISNINLNMVFILVLYALISVPFILFTILVKVKKN